MRVLVAEDDPDVGADLDQALGEAGFTVELVVDGNDVWSRGGVEDFALVVLDLGLPSLDGLGDSSSMACGRKKFPIRPLCPGRLD